MFSLCGCSPTTKHGPGLFPLVPSLTYWLSCAALQKHLNLRWQKCVQLISSTVAPSSGFLLHNTGHHRKSRVHTGTQSLYSLGGAVPVRPVLCHCLLWCCESHLTVCAHTLYFRYFTLWTRSQERYSTPTVLLDTLFRPMCFYFTVGYSLPSFWAKLLGGRLAAEAGENGNHQKETLPSLAVSHSCPLTVHLKVH